MDHINMDDIKKLSAEEVTALNRKLGAKVLKQFALIQGVKWALIIGLTYIAKKHLEEPKSD